MRSIAAVSSLLVFSHFTTVALGQIRLDLKPQVQTKAQIKAIDEHTGKTFVQRQRHRAAVQLLGKRSAKVQDFPAADVLNTYTAVVTIGKRDFDLLIDTGSSFTWVGSGDAKFRKTLTSRDQHRTFDAAYGSGSAHGEYWKDTLQFGGSSATSMKNQGFGNASSSDSFNYADGIVGFGPTSLSSGVVEGTGSVATVMDTLFRQNRLPAKVMSVAFAPNTAGTKAPRGTLILGGVDNSLYTGSITYAPQTTVAPASYYWGAKIDKFVYGSKTISTGPTGIVDTGTTLLLLPADAFSTYLNAIPGAYVDSSTGLTIVPRASYYAMSNLTIFWHGKPYTFIPDAQLMPPALGSSFEGYNPDNSFVSIVASSGTSRYTIGMTALTRFYSVYDYANDRIGLATTSHTYDRTAGMPLAAAKKAKVTSTTRRVTTTKKTSPTKRATSTKHTSTKHKRDDLPTPAFQRRIRDES